MIDAHSSAVLKKSYVLLIALIISVLMGGVVFALLQTPAPQNIMYDLVQANIQQSGVTNPVTAVLLNFRAYDTFLEFAVFFCVSIASLPYLDSSVSDASHLEAKDGPLFSLVKVLAPLTILLAGYTLWVGSFKPGGAFQAGALLAGCGLLLTLSNAGVTKMNGFWWRSIFSMSLLFFILVIGFSYLHTHTFLMYPTTLSGSLILFIEFAATFSVAATLYLCYLSVRGRVVQGSHRAG
jgi:multisubunit Na+/H+ antiporter MnhB subunit